ncbi:MAG: lysine--tRNA ligase [Candidatus Omnitrophica bacterium]|nr:lysine--tRNA ligase [Candidatus Omnitrophota bacterium]
MEINEILQQRESKLASLKGKSVSAFASPAFARAPIGEALADFSEGKAVSVCGRVISRRLHGKVIFADLRDSTGKIQLYIKSDIVGKEPFSLFQDDIDIADFIQVRGELFKTHTQEPTVKVTDFSVLTKTLRPLPEKWHGLKDVELRYRQRYLDLIANEEIREVFLKRSRIISSIRKFLDEKGFLEVETPMMHGIAGGAAGRPFKTHHNEYDMDLYLRIAPELYLKRLLVGGLDKVYEINRSFRNEGVSTRHNPEFTMLEVYEAYSNVEGMMRLTQELIVSAAKEVFGKTNFAFGDKSFDLAGEWRVVSFAKVVKEKFGIEPGQEPDQMLKLLKEKGFARDAAKLTRSQIAKIIEEILEQDMSADPTFVIDYFTSLCPLAKTKKEDPLISERFELYIAGFEVGNAYTELHDPVEQRERFEEEIKDLDPSEKKVVDEDYCLALEHGMPPAGGLGIGIDRMVMLLTGQTSIRDVILFPLLRPVE